MLCSLGWGVWWQLTRERTTAYDPAHAHAHAVLSSARVLHPVRDVEAVELVERAVEGDPEAAAKEAVTLHPEALAGILAQWAEKDIVAAERWARTLQGSLREQVLGILAVEAVRANLEAAGGIAAAMEDGPAKNEAYAFVAAQWAAQDAEGALEWIRSIDGSALRDTVERRAIPAIAQDQPMLAAIYASGEMQNLQLQTAVVPEIVGRWVQTDPVAAASWVQQINQEELRERSLRVLLSIWMTQDPDGVQRWLEHLPTGPFRTQVVALRK